MRKTLFTDAPIRRRKIASLTLLSIILPISLLVTFRIAGIVREPPETQTITVNAVIWNMTRPSLFSNMNAWVNNSYADIVNFNIFVNHYIDNHQERGDYLEFWVHLNASVNDGFIQSMVIHFSRIDSNAYLNIIEDPDWISLRNLSIEAIHDWRTNNDIQANAVGRPAEVSLKAGVWWMFTDEDSIDHSLPLSAEVTYFDGTMYQKVIIPICVEVLPKPSMVFP